MQLVELTQYQLLIDSKMVIFIMAKYIYVSKPSHLHLVQLSLAPVIMMEELLHLLNLITGLYHHQMQGQYQELPVTQHGMTDLLVTQRFR